MMGMPPHTAASNFSSTPFAAARAKSSCPCAESSALFAVMTCFFRVSAPRGRGAAALDAAGQLHDDRHGGVVQDLSPAAAPRACPSPTAAALPGVPHADPRAPRRPRRAGGRTPRRCGSAAGRSSPRPSRSRPGRSLLGPYVRHLRVLAQAREDLLRIRPPGSGTTPATTISPPPLPSPTWKNSEQLPRRSSRYSRISCRLSSVPTSSLQPARAPPARASAAGPPEP